ncbi:MAG: histidinol dehydrogenase, partial [Planctomycetota bacterium]|nr:histidinol dehydrogenase [Planctomycetota bacterium]
MPALNIVTHGTPESEGPIRKIRDRFVLQLTQASAVATEKTVAVFGEALTPVESVRRIIEAVRDRGDEGLLEFASKLDGLECTADQLRVPESEIESASEKIDPALLETLHLAASNIRRFQEHIRIP